MEKIILDSPILDLNVNKDFCEVTDFEKEMISNIFIEEFQEKPVDIKKINSRFAYDSYRVNLEEYSYVIKISFLPQNTVLENEFKNLNLANKKYPYLLAPQAIKLKEKEEYCYLITSFENAQCYEDYSINDLFQNIDTFSSFVDAIHEIDIEDAKNLSQKLEYDLSITELKQEIPENDAQAFAEYYQVTFEQLEDILNDLKKFIQENYKEDNLVFSNFMIKQSTLIFRDDIIKCVNYEECYALDLHLSLKNIALNLGLNFSEKGEKLFLKSYLKMCRKFSFNESEFINQYYEKNKVNRAIILVHILSKQLFHLFSNGHSNAEFYYTNFEKYNHIRKSNKEILGDKIKKLDKIFNVALTNKGIN